MYISNRKVRNLRWLNLSPLVPLVSIRGQQIHSSVVCVQEGEDSRVEVVWLAFHKAFSSNPGSPLTKSTETSEKHSLLYFSVHQVC